MYGDQHEFWEALDALAAKSTVIIDRPKDSVHPKYPKLRYPLDYGYLQGTMAMDNEGIDVWRGSKPDKAVDAIICIVDLAKRETEIKLLMGCTEEEKETVYHFHNQTELMKGILIKRHEEER